LETGTIQKRQQVARRQSGKAKVESETSTKPGSIGVPARRNLRNWSEAGRSCL